MHPAASRPVGRFAPSPTGPLHFGSLITAIASYCDIKAQGGDWLVRLEDTDIPRIQAGAETQIIDALDAFGLIPDRPILRQQDRLDHYEQALQQLAQQRLIYGCACTRKILDATQPYPSTCRDANLPFVGHAIRLRVGDRPITFVDRLQGRQTEQLTRTLGDFVLKRRDGIISYQLAVVVDDADQGITDVVRGCDLLDNTARQIWLGHCLGAHPLRYTHLPLAMNAQGQKLSKQNLALALDLNQASRLMRQALLALGQPDPKFGSPTALLQHAVRHWSLAKIPAQATLADIYQ
ncbi:MAG: tRNA glutamyl-Q(34) synthetase GluQRS [Pseudomonadota bacterium]|nr:tRNA glutamyl-Q(34) synthetase GluQRS [Pseudomonadota bacterium]